MNRERDREDVCKKKETKVCFCIAKLFLRLLRSLGSQCGTQINAEARMEGGGNKER